MDTKLKNKVCTKCGESKCLSDFGADKRYSADGLRSRCKECLYRERKKYVEKNRDRLNDINMKSYYKNRQKRLAAMRDSYQQNKEKRLAGMLRYLIEKKRDKKHVKKVRAVALINKYIANGWIEKEPCQVCGDKNVQAHHHKGYTGDNKLDVQWLCVFHHRERHLTERGKKIRTEVHCEK